MDKVEVRSILSAYRAGESDDARFETARAAAESDPALAQWWQEEQELDRLIAQKLESVATPAGLRARLLQPEWRAIPRRATWPRKVGLLAAGIVLLAVFFGSWRGFFQPTTSLADYRDEMVGFVRLDPVLDLKTTEMGQMSSFLKEKGAPSEMNVPPPMQQLQPIGCRTLRFRGEDVALVCFHGTGGEMVHLFVVNRKAMANAQSGDGPQYAAQGEWMTATWMDGDHAYLLTTKGSREALERYLGTS